MSGVDSQARLAGREKAGEFCAAMLGPKLVKRSTLKTRLAKVENLNPLVREKVTSMLKA